MECVQFVNEPANEYRTAAMTNPNSKAVGWCRLFRSGCRTSLLVSLATLALMAAPFSAQAQAEPPVTSIILQSGERAERAGGEPEIAGRYYYADSGPGFNFQRSSMDLMTGRLVPEGRGTLETRTMATLGRPDPYADRPVTALP